MNPASSRTARDRHRTEVAAWKQIVAPHEKPSALRGWWQAGSTLAAYALVWVLLWWLRPLAWWEVAPLILLGGGLLARLFVIFHDCCHGSLLPSGRANQWLGFFTGVLVFTSFRHWRWEHSLHHATAGDLDRRGVGDVWTMTVDEYLAAGWWRRLLYRLMRNPVIYYLERCHNSHELFRKVPALSMRASLGCLRFRLWNEAEKRLVGFGDLRHATQPVSSTAGA
jgi:omega-6 fatty acid desaturase (delta-12 desaturase)